MSSVCESPASGRVDFHVLSVMGTNQGGLQETGHANRLSKGTWGWPRQASQLWLCVRMHSLRPPRVWFTCSWVRPGTSICKSNSGDSHGQSRWRITGPREVCLLKVNNHGTEVQSWIKSLRALPAPPEERSRMVLYLPYIPHPAQCLTHGKCSVYTDGRKK